MKFENRVTQFPGKRKLIKVDAGNRQIAGESETFVNIVKDEGSVYVEGTPITAENLNQGNWRDDNSVSFRKRSDNVLPEAIDETQIITKANGETWLIPPKNCGAGIEIADSVGTTIKIGGNAQSQVSFTSDPQTQITSAKNTADSKSIVNINSVKANVNFISDPQTQINGKSIVKINNVRADVNFTSDPQTQISSKAGQTSLDSLSQSVTGHIANKTNPHSVTKAQVGLGNVDNTSDVNKPISSVQQTALNAKVDTTRLNGLKKWQVLYDAGAGTGFLAGGNTTMFGTNIVDNSVFRVHMRDNRTREFNGIYTRFTQTGLIIFRNGEDALWQYDSPYDTGVGFRIRTLFRRIGVNGVNIFTHASPVASEGNTNWVGQDSNFFIVRIEKEVDV